jgi:regulation of enolase protein 1 (concanavalin A-like superfamily)
MKYYLLAAGLWLYSTSLFAQNIVINEVVPSNAHYVDEDNEASDWIELYNAGTQPAHLHKYRISDRNNPAYAWEIPDTVVSPGGFLLLRASGNNRISSGYYAIEAEGSGINPWNTWDSFRFLYLPAEGNMDMAVHIRALQKEANYTKAGLVFLDGLNKKNRYTGIFATTRGVFTYGKRLAEGAPPDQMSDAFAPDYPDAWVRLKRQGDSIYTYISLLGDFWEPVDSSYFPTDDNTGYIGIAVTSGQPGALTRAVVSEVLVNGSLLSPTALQTKEFGTEVTGATYKLDEYHTNFELSRDGETIYLWDQDGLLVDSLAYGKIYTGISCGRSAVDGSSTVYFDTPSPGATNGEGRARIADAPVWSSEGGIYENAVPLSFEKKQAGDRIFYSLDGSEPDTTSLKYDGTPVVLASTATIRVRVFADDAITSPVYTNTYIINETRHLPVVAVTSDPYYLWGSEGIFDNIAYTHEVPVHVEFWEDNGVQALHQDAGMKLQGRVSRALPQKAMRFYARGEYGAKLFDYPLFATRPMDSYNHFLLRSSGQDWYSTYLRDAVFASVISNLHVDVQAYRPCMVFLNGNYWGIQNMRERVDDDFIAARYNVSTDNIDFLEENSIPKQGSSKEYHWLVDTLASMDMSEEQAYTFAGSHIDLDNFTDYSIAQIYAAAGDWPQYNQRYWRERSEQGRWRWILTDVDMGLGMYGDTLACRKDVLAIATSPVQDAVVNPPYSTFLLRTLLANPKFKTNFINRAADVLNTTFARERFVHFIDSLADGIAADVPRHTERWNESIQNWENELEKFRYFVKNRPGFVFEHFVRKFKLGDTVQVTLNTNIAGAGFIRFSTLTHTSLPWSGTYFTDVPVTATAIAAPGYRFVRWSLDELPDTASVTVELHTSVQLTAIFAEDSEVEDTGVVINEIMYKPADDRDSKDWIELYNSSSTAVDLSKWVLKDDDDKHTFMIPDGTVLPANGYIVLCNDVTAFRTVYPTEQIALVGNISYGFGNPSDQVRLYDAAGILVDSVSYDAKAPWPTGASGTGRSIELLLPSLDNTLGQNWRTSTSASGSPGRPNSLETYIINPPTVSVALACYPNPMASQTLVYYRLEQTGSVRLSLWDYLGREVLVVASSEQAEIGDHQVVMTTDNLMPGAYLLRMEVTDGASRSHSTLPVVIVR